MHHWTKRLFAIAVPLLLTSCLWGPGKFTSELALHKDGSFVLDYRGQIVLQLPSDDKVEPWNPSTAHCADDEGSDRSCTNAEVAEQKAEYDKQAANKRQQSRRDGKGFRPARARR